MNFIIQIKYEYEKGSHFLNGDSCIEIIASTRNFQSN